MGNIAALISQVRYLSNGSGFLQLFGPAAAMDSGRPGRTRPRMLKMDRSLPISRAGNFASNSSRTDQGWPRAGSAEEKPGRANLGAKPLSEIALGHNVPAARWPTMQRKLAAILFADV